MSVSLSVLHELADDIWPQFFDEDAWTTEAAAGNVRDRNRGRKKFGSERIYPSIASRSFCSVTHHCPAIYCHINNAITIAPAKVERWHGATHGICGVD
jgi:hypothetical protein